ncbi:hypothetical protein MO973_19480 [Paenibacillus sp. TRM 82003]|nr:hypothetical protein [Paenibacillus sp. TRM 82003]
MMGIGDWIVKKLLGRLSTLSLEEFRDIIKHADDIETLRTLYTHLKTGYIKWKLVEVNKFELIQLMDDRAKAIGVKQAVEEATKHFYETWGGLH